MLEDVLKLTKNKEFIDNLVIDHKERYHSVPNTLMIPANQLPKEYAFKSSVKFDDIDVSIIVTPAGSPIVMTVK